MTRGTSEVVDMPSNFFFLPRARYAYFGSALGVFSLPRFLFSSGVSFVVVVFLVKRFQLENASGDVDRV